MDFAYYIANPDKLDRSTLFKLRVTVGKYPCFDAARLLLLKNLYVLHDIEFGKEMRRAALYLKDRRVLFDLMREYGNPVATAAVQAAEETTVDRTMELIDAFLDTLPTNSFSLEAEGAAAIDYVSAYIADKEDVSDSPRLRGQDLIDKFLEGDGERSTFAISDGEETDTEPADAEVKPAAENVAKEPETPTFTETLANIYLKQGKYDKALEILKRINLEYPNKNRYFADQIRFLEKIVKHTKRK